jgi:hypothetical protein
MTTTTEPADLRRPRGRRPAPGASAWNAMHHIVSATIVGAAALAAVFLGVTGPLTSPVDPATVTMAAAAAADSSATESTDDLAVDDAGRTRDNARDGRRRGRTEDGRGQ